MPKPRTESLARRPKLDRLAAGVGIAPREGGESPIDREGGEYKAGLISGVAVITRGPALGHGMWIDATTLQQTADLINAAPKGVKSRFTHPGLSGDGMGKHLGRAKAAAVDGDIARADLHLFDAARRGPDGDLASHVMDLAEEDPEAFGNSIAFEHDIEAENAFVEEHGGKVIDTVWGIYDLTDFKSPDPLNTENTFHVRLKALRAVDVVDEPAANPSGMFHRGQEIPAEADALCEYAFGLTDVRPASAALGIDPDRLRGFASRFLSSRGITLNSKEAEVPKSKLTEGTNAGAADGGQTGSQAGDQTGDQTGGQAGGQSGGEASGSAGAAGGSGEAGAKEGEADGDGKPAGESGSAAGAGSAEGGAPAGEADGGGQLSAFRTQLAQFIALDPIDGPKWLSEGKTFAEAQGLAMGKLQAEKTGLQSKLTAALAAAGGEVIDGGHEGGADPPKTDAASTPLSRFAASIKLPGRK